MELADTLFSAPPFVFFTISSSSIFFCVLGDGASGASPLVAVVDVLLGAVDPAVDEVDLVLASTISSSVLLLRRLAFMGRRALLEEKVTERISLLPLPKPRLPIWCAKRKEHQRCSWCLGSKEPATGAGWSQGGKRILGKCAR